MYLQFTNPRDFKDWLDIKKISEDNVHQSSNPLSPNKYSGYLKNSFMHNIGSFEDSSDFGVVVTLKVGYEQYGNGYEKFQVNSDSIKPIKKSMLKQVKSIENSLK